MDIFGFKKSLTSAGVLMSNRIALIPIVSVLAVVTMATCGIMLTVYAGSAALATR